VAPRATAQHGPEVSVAETGWGRRVVELLPLRSHTASNLAVSDVGASSDGASPRLNYLQVFVVAPVSHSRLRCPIVASQIHTNLVSRALKILRGSLAVEDASNPPTTTMALSVRQFPNATCLSPVSGSL
jgi:hypothetical protein